MSANSPMDPVAWPVLSAAELADMATFASERSTEVGELLFQAGEASYDLFVILEGEVQVVRSGGADEALVAEFGPGGFVGELTLLTGQRRFLTCRVVSPGRVLVIAQEDFRRLMSVRPALAETIFNALLARREYLRTGEGAQAIRIIGSRYSPEAMSLRSFAEHSHLAHAWIDVEDAEDLDGLLAGMGLRAQDIPAVITATDTLCKPSTAAFAEHLGLTFQPIPGYVFDLVVIGSGPAGLAAAVYGASEGLRTVSLDAVAIGGQAGASSRIENYAGFPNGISGEELTGRTAVQAMRLGARLNSPCEVVGLHSQGSFHVISLRDGSEIPTRAVLIASGARYQRLEVDDLERFEGAGVYYAATAAKPGQHRDHQSTAVRDFDARCVRRRRCPPRLDEAGGGGCGRGVKRGALGSRAPGHRGLASATMTHMELVGIREMRQNLSRYAQRARHGESFVITDRGQEVAQRGARRGQGSLLDVMEQLPSPIPGPPTDEVLDDLRSERL